MNLLKINKWVILCQLILLANTGWISAQSNAPYAWKAGVDIPLLVGGGGTLFAGRIMTGKTKPLSLAQINAAQKTDIFPKFDRSAANNWSTKHAHTSDVLLKVSIAMPVSLVISPDVRNNNILLTGTIAFETLLLTAGLTEIVKNSARRKRPYVYNPAAPISEKMKIDARRSFFSGHTSTSTAACFFGAKVFSDFYPNSPWKPAVWALAGALPATVGLYRYKAGKHFPSDIIVGYAIGAFCGFIVPQLHKK